MTPTTRIAALRRVGLHILADEFAAITAQRDSLLAQIVGFRAQQISPARLRDEIRSRCTVAGIDLAEAERVTGLQLGRRTA